MIEKFCVVVYDGHTDGQEICYTKLLQNNVTMTIISKKKLAFPVNFKTKLVLRL